MTASIPQLVSLVAVAIGALLFFVSLRYINLVDTIDDVRRLGFAFPLILVPGCVWHLLRTWGWWIAFPDNARPSFSRLFRVRLAADAISFFTVRGITGEPLKVVLLYDRIPPAVTAAAITLERTAFAVMAIVISGLVSYFAVQRLQMPGGWDAVFTLLSIGAVLLLGVLVFIARRRTGDYLGRFVQPHRRDDRTTSRVVSRHPLHSRRRGHRPRPASWRPSPVDHPHHAAGRLLRHHGVRSVARAVGGGRTSRHHCRSRDRDVRATRQRRVGVHPRQHRRARSLERRAGRDARPRRRRRARAVSPRPRHVMGGARA